MDTYEDKTMAVAMENQPVLNIGMLGHVQNGKSTIVKSLTNKHTQQHSDEKSRNITIKLGYANAKIYKCESCEPPGCYSSASSDVYELKCKNCSAQMKLVSHVSFVDCFGIDTKIITGDGSIKRANELIVDDILIGTDGKPTKIVNIKNGKKMLYQVHYGDRSNHDIVNNNFTCTGGHLLVLYMKKNVTDIFFEKDMYVYDIYTINSAGVLSSKRKTFSTYISAYASNKLETIEEYKFNMTVETYLNTENNFKKNVYMMYCGEIEFDKTFAKYDFELSNLKKSEIGWLFGIWLASADMKETILNNIIVLNKLKILNFRNNNILSQFHKMIYALNITHNTQNLEQYLLFQCKEFRDSLVAGISDVANLNGNGVYSLKKPEKYLNIINLIEKVLKSMNYDVSITKSKSKKKNHYYCLNYNGENCKLQPFFVTQVGVQEYIGFEVDNMNGEFLLGDLLCVHNCPGHHGLMATMLNGTCVMDYSILVESLNNVSIPSPQTVEHLNATAVTGVQNKIVCVNKLDLVSREDAEKKIKLFKKKLVGTIAEKSPIVPIVASRNLNTDILSEYLANLPVPMRSFDIRDTKMYVIRSFNINKPGTQISNLSGGVVGGSMSNGVLRKDMNVVLKPGYIYKIGESWSYKQLNAKILSIHSEKNNLNYAIPGGLIGVQLDIDPGLCSNDKLSGNVLIPEENSSMYDVYDEITVNYISFNGKNNLDKNMRISLNINADNKIGNILNVEDDLVTIKTSDPTCLKIGDTITISNIDDGLKVIGKGKFIYGHKI